MEEWVKLILGALSLLGIVLTAKKTSGDNVQKLKNERIIISKEKIMQERLQYLKMIQDTGIKVIGDFQPIRDAIQDGIFFNKNHIFNGEIMLAEEERSAAISKKYDEIESKFYDLLSSFRHKYNSLLIHLNPRSEDDSPEVKLERCLKIYDEICVEYFRYELDRQKNTPAPDPVSELEVSKKSILYLEEEILNSIREISKETWTQVISEFEVEKIE